MSQKLIKNITFVIVTVIFTLFVSQYANAPVPADNDGCCLSPIMGMIGQYCSLENPCEGLTCGYTTDPECYFDQPTRIASCCGPMDLSEFAECNATFMSNVNNCTGIFNLTPIGCCVVEDSCTSDFTYRIECEEVGGISHIQACSEVADCLLGCCVWSDDGSNYCKYIEEVACDNLNNTGFVPEGYSLNTFNESIASDGECQTWCGTAPPPGSGSIHGFVKNITGDPLPDVTVTNGPQTDTTDTYGEYTLSNVVAGHNSVQASKSGYITNSTLVYVASGSTVEQNFTLLPEQIGRVQVWVTDDQATPIDIQGASLTLTGANTYTGTTDVGGEYTFSNIPTGPYTLTTTKLGFDSDITTVDVVALTTTFLAIQLSALATYNISGYVLKGAGAESVDLISLTVAADGDLDYTDAPDGTGLYKITGVAEGWYDIYVSNRPADIESTYQGLYVSQDWNNIDLTISGIVGAYCSDYISPVNFCQIGYCDGFPNVATSDVPAGGYVCCDVCLPTPGEDSDNDGVPDESDVCPFEPSIATGIEIWYNPGGESGFEWEGNYGCNDSIDNDCDSTWYLGGTEPNTNRQDSPSESGYDFFDPDCGYCNLPDADRTCDYALNKYCNETASQENLEINVTEYTMPQDNEIYCSLCPGDSECLNQCEYEGGVCCNQCDTVATTYEWACDYVYQKCCSACLPADEEVYECCESWRCIYEYAAGDTQFKCGANEIACTECQSIPFCDSWTNISDVNNTYFNPEDPARASVVEKCWCAGSFYNTIWNGTDYDVGRSSNDYCCGWDSSSTSSTPCYPPARFRIEFTVKEKNESGGAAKSLDNNVQVDVWNTATYQGCTFKSTPVEDSCIVLDYYDNESQQTFRITADGYMAKTVTVTIYDTDPNVHTVELEKGESCDDVPVPKIRSLRVRIIIGEEKLNLTWNTTCETIHSFTITREKVGVPGQTVVYNDLANKGQTYYSDVDEDVEWDTWYTYYIKATYNLTSVDLGYKESAEYSNTETGNTQNTPGNWQCEGIGHDEELCLNSMKGIDGVLTIESKCHNNLIPDVWVVGLNCTQEHGDDGICVKLADKTTTCRIREDCRDETEPGVFGLYYTNESCVEYDEEIPGMSSYCYYDYSNTTVDACYDCETDMNCYTYRSEDACLYDNCVAAGRHEPSGTACSWLSTYGEMGKGICYKPGYTGTEYCNMCNISKNAPFDNPDCTVDVCDKLGSCFPVEDYDRCDSCSDTTKCEDYINEESCIGITQKQNFSIGDTSSCRSNETFIYSNDMCELGVCKWDGTSCFKDANDDGVPDCTTSNTCKQDTQPPVTTITQQPICQNEHGADLAPCINSRGSKTIFSISENVGSNINDSFYCLSKNDDWYCPNISITSSFHSGEPQKNLTLPSDFSIYFNENNIPQGNVELRFYSVDKYSNVEPINMQEVFIDTTRPTITNFQYSYENQTGDDYASVLSFNLTTSEDALCFDDTLKDASWQDLAGDGIVDIQVLGNSIYRDFSDGNYSDLLDGTYFYVVNCTDVFGNINEEQLYLINIRRFKGILEQRPDENPGPSPEEERVNNIYASSPVELYLKTGRDITCQYDDSGTWTDFTTVIDGTDAIAGAYTNHSVDYPVTSDGRYVVEARCNDSATGEFRGQTSFTFAKDTTAPSTTLYYLDNEQPVELDDSVWYKSSDLTKTRFDCSDPEITGMPGEAVCGEDVSYCLSYPFECTPNVPIAWRTEELDLSGETSTWLCYQSTDKKGNVENRVCKYIQIDDDAPSVGITSLYNNFVTDQDWILVSGNWDDTAGGASGVENVIVTYRDDSDVTTSVYGNYFTYGNTEHTKGTFTTGITTPEPILLYEGRNRIKAKATDFAGNPQETSEMAVYLDHVGPEINNPVIKNENGINVADDFTKHVEWGTGIINFSIEVSDPHWTNLDSPSHSAVLSINDEWPSRDMSSFNYTYRFTPKPPYPGDYEETPGIWNINYIALDRLGNPTTLTQFFNVNDTVAPTFDITLSYDEVVLEGKEYPVTVTASEPLDPLRDLNLWFICGGTNIDLFELLGRQSAVEYTGILKINYSADSKHLSCKNIEGNVEFSIEGFDQNGVRGTVITSGKEFFMDTKKPREPNIIYPAAGLIYSNSANVFITGYGLDYSGIPMYNINITALVTQDDSVGRIGPQYFPLGHMVWNETYSDLSAPDPEKSDQWASTTAEERYAGDNYVIIDDVAAFGDVTKYIKFENHQRATHQFYDINGYYESTYTHPKMNLTFTPTLEGGVPQGTVIELYTRPVPLGWYSFNMNFAEGLHYVYIFQVDNHSLRSDQAASRTIIYDETAPKVTLVTPSEERITNDNSTNITISINDSKAGINVSGIAQGTISVVFNSTDGYINSGTLTCGSTLKCDCDANTCTLSLDPSDLGFDELLIGDYSAYISVTDNALNVNESRLRFGVDPSTPEYPTYSISDVYDDVGMLMSKDRSVWYTDNTSPDITMEFIDNVTVSSYSLRDSLANPISIALSASTDNKIFVFTVGETLTGNTYTFATYSQKILGDGSFGTHLYDEIAIVVDTTAPVVIDKSVENLDGGAELERGELFYINVSVEDASPDVNISIDIKNDASGGTVYTDSLVTESDIPPTGQYQLLITPTRTGATYDIDYGSHTVYFTVTDTFGHVDSTASLSFFVDDTGGPEISLYNMNPGIAYNSTFGRTYNRTPTIYVNTSEYATCELQDGTGFSTSDGLTHNVQLIEDNALGSQMARLFTISCRDDYYNSNSISITLEHDSIAPIINNLYSSRGDYIDEYEGNNITSLVAEANEKAKCKYYGNISEDIASLPAPGVNARTFYDTDMDYMSQEFATISSVDLTDIIENTPQGRNNSNWIFYVGCGDDLGNKLYQGALNTLEFNVNIIKLSITDQEPTIATISTDSVDISVTTDKVSTCIYREGGGSWAELPTTDDYYHYRTISSLQHGTSYNYEIRCETIYSPVRTASTTIAFYVDLEVNPPPQITNLLNSSGQAITQANQYQDEITVNGTVEANSFVRVVVNGEDTGFTTTSTSEDRFNVSVSLAPYGEETITINVRATDPFGHVAESSQVSLTLDRVAPGMPALYELEEFTNQEIINVYGFTRETGTTAYIYVANDSKLSNRREYSGPAIDGTLQVVDTIALDNSYPVGSTQMEILDTEVGDLDEDDWVEFTSHESQNYVRYDIIDVDWELFGIYTLVTISPALQEDITAGDSIKVYDSQYPTGWFNVSVMLTTDRNWVSAKAKDSMDNFGDAVYPFYTITYDNVTPELANEFPSGGTYTNYNRTDIRIGVTDNYYVEQEGIKITIDGTEYAPSQFSDDVATLSYQDYATELTAGIRTVTLTAMDVAGNTKSIEWTFTVDPTVPTIPTFTVTPGTSKLNTDWYSTSKTSVIKAEFVEEVVLNDYKFVKGGGAEKTMTESQQGNNYTFTPASSLEDGDYILSINASKVIGQTTGIPNTYIMRLTIDSTAPSVTNAVVYENDNAGDDPNIEYTSSITIAVNVNDGTGTGVDSVKATVNSVEYNMSEVNPNIYELDLGVLEVGTYSITYIAEDNLGNINDSITDSFTVEDTTPPQITIISPQQGETTKDIHRNVSVKVEDASLIDTNSFIIRIDSGEPKELARFSYNTTTKILTYDPEYDWLTDNFMLPDTDLHTFNIYLRVDDIYGNPASQTWPFIIDIRASQITSAVWNDFYGVLEPTALEKSNRVYTRISKPKIVFNFDTDVVNTQTTLKNETNETVALVRTGDTDSKTEFIYTLHLSVPELGEGDYSLTITADRELTGKTTPEEYYVTVDTTGPIGDIEIE